MKVTRVIFLLLAASLFAASSAPPAGAGEADASRRAAALLAESERQNYEDHARALETARQALALWLTTGDKAGAARAYAQVGRCHTAQSNLPEATESYEEALRLWRELNDRQGQADALIELGFIEARKGEWARSVEILVEAQPLVSEADEPYRAGQIENGLAYVFTHSGMPEVGLAHNQKALDFWRLTPGERDDVAVYIEMGRANLLLERYAEALSHLERALGMVAPGSLDAALCQQHLGRVYAAQGNYAAALTHLEAALPIYVKASNPREEAQVRALLGQVAQRQGRPEPARRLYRRALATFTRLSDRVNESAVYYALGQLELGQGNDDAAEEHLRRSVEATENVRRAPTSSDLTAAFSATVYERYETYVECLMRRHARQPSRGLDVRAFEVSELARARSLSELLRATQTSPAPGLDPELASREKLLRQSLRVKEDRKVSLLARAGGREAQNTRRELAALDAELARLEDDYRQVNEEVRARYPAYEQLTRPASWDLRRIQREVVADDETVLLEYALGDERGYVWAVTRGGFKSYALPARAEIEAAAGKVYGLLSGWPERRDEEGLAAATRELSRLVLAPVAAELNRRRVVVVADGALNYIPFQMLPAPARDEEPLVARHEVVNAPSATILGELRGEAARRRPAAKALAAFGDPVFEADYARRKEAGAGGGQLAVVNPAAAGRALRGIELDGDRFDPATVGPLLYAKRELANLGEVASGQGSLVAADFDATRAGLLGANLSDYAILHFATHGFLDPRRPEHSGLVLSTVDRDGRAQEGFVGLQDVYSLRAPVSLVVLSACRTALGKDVRGEGLLGLTRGFMYAGASSVVASLWKVDDEATAELMRQFYTNMLRKGLPPAAALREAQNSIRRTPRWRSPYYWAAFTLQGEYTRAVTPAPPAPATHAVYAKVTAGVLLALLALLAGAGLWYKRRGRRNDKR